MARPKNNDSLLAGAQTSDLGADSDGMGAVTNGRKPTQMSWEPIYLTGAINELLGSAFIQIFRTAVVSLMLYISSQRECCPNPLVAAAATGAAYLMAAYTFSGFYAAHFNPAITFVYWGLNKIMFMYALLLWVAQFAGYVLGSAICKYLFESFDATLGMPVPAAGFDGGRVFFAEMLAMLFLTYMILVKGKLCKMQPYVYGGVVFVIACVLNYFTGTALSSFSYIGVGIFAGTVTGWPAWGAYVFSSWVGAIAAGIFYYLFTMRMKNDIRRAKASGKMMAQA
jgi:glycerol uptake facilitator-like aquaporin